MPKSFQINSFITLALVVAFYFFFMFTKHDPALSAIIPFAFDPYDAIGSFGLIISVLLWVLSLFRAFRPYRFGPPSWRQKTYLARTHMAIVLGVLIPLAADLVAMARHSSLWMGTAVTNEFLMLFTGMVAFSLIVLFLVRNAAREINLPIIPNEWRRALIVSLVFVAVLALYPENIIRNPFGELFTLAVGIVLLFLPQSALVVALVPHNTDGIEGKYSNMHGWLSRRSMQWVTVALLGIAIGTFLLLGEAGESGGGIPLVRLLMVAAVFIGAGTTGLLVAYYFLRKPLGLFQQ